MKSEIDACGTQCSDEEKYAAVSFFRACAQKKEVSCRKIPS